MTGDAGRHLVLVGMMGSGKTTVGERCAARLGRPFVDTDVLVEAVAGCPVGAIFDRDGEDAFRALERRALGDALASPVPAVVSCGGGAVLDPANRRAMRRAGTVVWLRAAPPVLAARVGVPGASGGRPLLAGGATTATLERLARQREPAYEDAATVVVDTDTLGADDAAGAVLAAFAAAAPGAPGPAPESAA